MKNCAACIAIGVSAHRAGSIIAQAGFSAPPVQWNFDNDSTGTAPPTWRVAETNGNGRTGVWTVVADATAPSKPNVVSLDAHADGSTLNLLIAEHTSFQDLDLRTRIKPISGREDQGGGLIWRCIDAKNYYICRINPLESNFRVYKVEKGRRSRLASVKLETKAGQWYEVRAVMVGDRIECFVDGKKCLSAEDNTFRAPGMVGLWTKADASSSFDNIVVQRPESGESKGHAPGNPTAASRAMHKIDPATIERVTGMEAAAVEDGSVVKVSSPRRDVTVRVDGQTLDPFRGLTSWAAFTDGKQEEAMVMGDVVLFQDEVNPAMSAALDTGLTVTALHNHFFYDEPKVYFMHIGGEGSTEQLAAGVRKVFDAIEQIRMHSAVPATGYDNGPTAKDNRISAEPLEAILGRAAGKSDGMVKFVFGRSVTMDCGCTVGSAMGVNTWAVFAGTDGHAVVDGDFACLQGELQATLKTLRSHNVNIVAIHNHMEEETPRVFFLHYWGMGPATRLAEAIKATLDAQRVVAKP